MLVAIFIIMAFLIVYAVTLKKFVRRTISKKNGQKYGVTLRVRVLNLLG